MPKTIIHHQNHHPRLYISPYWRPASSQNERPWGVAYTWVQRRLKTSLTSLNFFSCCAGVFTIFPFIVRVVIKFMYNFAYEYGKSQMCEPEFEKITLSQRSQNGLFVIS